MGAPASATTGDTTTTTVDSSGVTGTGLYTGIIVNGHPVCPQGYVLYTEVAFTTGTASAGGVTVTLIPQVGSEDPGWIGVSAVSISGAIVYIATAGSHYQAFPGTLPWYTPTNGEGNNQNISHVGLCVTSTSSTTTTSVGGTTTTTNGGTTTTVLGPDDPTSTTATTMVLGPDDPTSTTSGSTSTSVLGPDDPELPNNGAGHLLAILLGGFGFVFMGSGSLVIATERRRLSR